MTTVQYCCTNDILPIKDKLKDLHSDTCHTELTDSCIDVSTEIKCSLVEVCKETEDKGINLKETGNKVVKHASKLENVLSFKDFKKPKTICLNTIEHHRRREPLRTLSQSRQHKSLKDKAGFSIDSVNSDLPNVLNATCNNFKESIKRKGIAVETNTNLAPFKENRAKFSEIIKLKRIQLEECDKTMRNSGEFYKETEFHNDGGTFLEESNKKLSLKVTEDSLDTLETNRVNQVDTLKECTYRAIKEKNVGILEESKSDKVNILEVCKLRNTFSLDENKTKFKVYYSNAYKMFSNVIQSARNKVNPRTKCNQTSISITEENTLLSKNPQTIDECTRVRMVNDYKYKLETLLYDLEELGEFLDYCSEEISHMISHFSACKGIVHFLSVEAEYIEGVLLDEQPEELFAEQNIKLNEEDLKTTTGTYNEIQELGHCLLAKITSQGKIWRPAIDIYKSNLDEVTGTVYKFCSTSIESELADDSDPVYALFKEVKTQIVRTQKIQSQVSNLFFTESAQIEGIRECIKRFRDMSNKMHN